ncbi:sensor domain-containing diguanylate cyclase [Lysobacter enzymogenes]|uniref:diguanylate cyclase n=1 Tax=Lysobacter enzymogenes TaxID=69 RepID=A0AAU9AIX4_LYSEN|nr:diguanylate cyclase [Lysobacter enzymogenes]BAV96084.1 GGDEF family protein [Lysobacter enzymogenes]
MDRSWRLLWQTLLALLGLSAAALACAQPFAVSRLGPGVDPPLAQVLSGRLDARFAPQQGERIVYSGRKPQWLRLVATAEIGEDELPQLVIDQPYRKFFDIWRHRDADPVRRALHGRGSEFQHSSRFVVYPLEGGLRKGEVIYLRTWATEFTPSTLRVEPLALVHRQDMSHVALRSVVLTALGATAILAFGFWVGLRERGYAYLSLTLLVQTVNLAVEGGEIRMLPWFQDVLPNRRTNVVLNTAAVIASVRFLVFYLDLRATQPAVTRVLNVCSWVLGALLLVSLVHTWSFSASFGNLMLLTVILTVAYASAVAIAQRQREAYFLLAAWAPLLAVLVVLVGGFQRWWPMFAWLEYAYPIGLVFGGLGLLLGLAAKLQKLRHDHDTAKHRATYDRLTSVMNRQAIEQALRDAIHAAHRTRRPLTVVFFDIDHFKRINDQHGHSAGDEALRSVAERTRQRLRSTDLCGRYGGDEILVGLPGTRLEQGLVVAEHLRRAVGANPPSLNGQPLNLSLSMGVAELRAGESYEQLLERADAALYASKAGGRDRVTVQQAAGEEVPI